MEKKQRFTSAIKENEGFIYKLAAAYTNTPEDRYDLMQEILYQLWKSFGSYAQQAALGTWIYQVALNVAIYHLKKAKKRIPLIPLDEQVPDIAESNSTQEENWKLLRQQLEKLDWLDKGVILLWLDNRSYDEIAAITGLSKTNVGTRLMRIKTKIKNEINKNL